jgi:hypothetical protein
VDVSGKLMLVTIGINGKGRVQLRRKKNKVEKKKRRCRWLWYVMTYFRNLNGQSGELTSEERETGWRQWEHADNVVIVLEADCRGVAGRVGERAKLGLRLESKCLSL